MLTSKQGGSYVWNKIIQTKEKILKDCSWRIGNGKSTKVWEDPWKEGIGIMKMAIAAESKVIQLDNHTHNSNQKNKTKDNYQELNTWNMNGAHKGKMLDHHTNHRDKITKNNQNNED